MNDSTIREAASIGSSICTSIENDAWHSIINAVDDSIWELVMNSLLDSGWESIRDFVGSSVGEYFEQK